MTIQGELRRPRGAVKINGTAMPSWKSWTWDGNSLYQADTFSVRLSLNDMPAANDAKWLSSQSDLQVELFAGFPANTDAGGTGTEGLESLFQGTTDDLDIDWDMGLVTLTGRDLTAAFLDNKTSEKFPNKTASQIATILAGRRGLTPVVKSTSTQVGRYYKDTHTRIEDDRTEWDLITWLAREEGFVVYVKAKELHFEPPPTSGTYKVTWTPGGRGKTPSGSVVRLKTGRTLTVARDITVTVNSWNSKQKKTFTRKATRSKKGSGQVQNYNYTIAGLKPEEAQLRANQILAELSRHEMRLTLDGPADNDLHKSDLITLSGTGTDFDQTFFPDAITRSMDCDGGYGFHVAAKNHSPESQPNL